MLRYTVVVSPPIPVIDAIAAMKEQLKERIGRYPSCNSQAHITFNLFTGGGETLQKWEDYLAAFTAQCSPMSLNFNHTGTFENGAFFLAPDEASQAKLVNMMKEFHRSAPANHFAKSTTPHISIGRQLSRQQLDIARELIQDVSVSFMCKDLVIRVFNPQRGQYDIYKRFTFGVTL